MLYDRLLEAATVSKGLSEFGINADKVKDDGGPGLVTAWHLSPFIDILSVLYVPLRSRALGDVAITNG